MKFRVVFRSVLCALLIAVLAPASEVRAGECHSVVKVGVLVSLTGSWSSLGQNTAAALNIAADQIETASRGRDRFRLLVRDTQLDPSKALDAIKDLDGHGVKIVIGPQSSAEVAQSQATTSSGFVLTICAKRRRSSR